MTITSSLRRFEGEPLLPVGWRKLRLADVATFINGDRGRNYPSPDDFVGDGIPFINAGHLNGKTVDFTDMNFITDGSFSALGSGKVQKGDILYCLRGSLGKTAIVTFDEAAAIASSLVIIRCSHDVDVRFLHYYLSGPLGQAKISRFNNGSSQPNLSATSVKEFNIPLPPLPEQKRIADILDKADAIRRKRQEAVDQADHILRSSYLELFGDPVANPNDWPMENLGSVADMVTGFAFKSSEYTPEGVRLCRGANVLPDVIDWSDVRFWRMDDSTIDPRMKLVAGDVVLAMDRPWISTGIKVAQITDVDLPAYLVQRVTRLRGEGFISNAFLYYTVRHPAFTAHCGGLKTETTIPHIASADIKSFPVPVAPKHIHERFELLAKNTQTAIQKLRLAANEAASLFNSLVQRAFKGDL